MFKLYSLSGVMPTQRVGSFYNKVSKSLCKSLCASFHKLLNGPCRKESLLAEQVKGRS